MENQAFIGLLLGSFIIYTVLLYNNKKNYILSYNSVRKSLLWSILLMSVLVLISTEFFSLFNILNFYTIVIYWFINVIIGVFLLYKYKKDIVFFSTNLNRLYIVTLVLLTLIFLLLLIFGILQPPNNWDSMTYHLSRIMHWIQNQSVDYYATHIERQVVFTTFSEYCILHTILLTGNDYFANSINLLAFIGTIICISLIIEQLGGTQKTVILGVFLFITIPMSIFQSLSTQNDLLASFFILTTYYFFLQWKSTHHKSSVVGIGIAMGLAILTKSTSYFFLAPIVLLIGFIYLKKRKSYLFYQGLSIAFIFILLNSFYFARNLMAFQSIIPETESTNNIRNEAIHFSFFVSNNIKTFGYNYTTNIVDVDRVLENVINGMHRILDVSPSDKTVSFGNFELPFRNKFFSQDYAPQTLHSWLMLFTLPLFYIFREKLPKDFFMVSLMIFLGFELMIFLIKWQPFGTRFQIPFWSWVSIWIAFTFNLVIARIKNGLFYLLIFGLFVVNLYYIFHCV